MSILYGMLTFRFDGGFLRLILHVSVLASAMNHNWVSLFLERERVILFEKRSLVRFVYCKWQLEWEIGHWKR